MVTIKSFLACSFLLAAAAYTHPAGAEANLSAPPRLAPMVERVLSSVVSFAVTGTSQSDPTPLLADPFFRQFFEDFGSLPPVESPVQAAGSGVIVDASNGLLLTNAHGVANAEQIAVRLMDGRESEADVVGVDPATDSAALRIAPDGPVEIHVGQSSTLHVGDYVVAFGTPFGLEQTVPLGIVSALGRRGLGIEGYENFIQTDASINPGTSGGALVNMDGELVGINTAILTPSQGSAGIGFAMPVAMAMAIVDQVLRDGQVRRRQIGVLVQDVTPDIVRALGPDVSDGALVARVVPGGPAEAADVQPRDVIVGLDGVPVVDAAALHHRIGLRSPDENVTPEVIRDGKRITVGAVLGQTDRAMGLPRPEAAEAEQLNRLQGLILTEDQGGVTVAGIAPMSDAARAGLMVGERIVAVANIPVFRLDPLCDAISAVPPGDPVLIKVDRQGTPFFSALP